MCESGHNSPHTQTHKHALRNRAEAEQETVEHRDEAIQTSSPHGVRNINKSLPQVLLVGKTNKCTDHRSTWPKSDALHDPINPELEKRGWNHLGSFTGPQEKMDPYDSNVQLSSEVLYCRSEGNERAG